MADSFSTALADAEQPRPVSKAAIASLVLSLVFCCPLTSLAGIVTGLFAVLGSGQKVTGKWLAILGMLLGVAGLTLQGAGGVLGYNAVVRPILIGPQNAIIAGQAGNITAFRDSFIPISDAKGGSEAAADAFIQELTNRYGTLKTAALDQNSAPSTPQSASQAFTGEYLLDFTNGRIRARCSMEIADQKGQLSMKIISVEVSDAQYGNLSYPAAPEGMP
ncbi:MAG: DUF4190 domain-containing protein [Planctomycetes bacterium]|nr:DUF4190 domain-containing protein [Planctomycetota bacterium]